MGWPGVGRVEENERIKSGSTRMNACCLTFDAGFEDSMQVSKIQCRFRRFNTGKKDSNAGCTRINAG